MKTISTEVYFQKGSALATALTTTFAEVFQYKASIDDTDPDKCKKVLEHVSKTTVEALKKIISEMTGIKVHSIMQAQNFSCMFGMILYLGDNPLAGSQVLSQMTGDFVNSTKMYNIMKQNEQEPITYEQLVSIMNSFDSKLSYYRENLGNPPSVKAQVDVVFDPYSAFLAKETGHAKVEVFEPQEIAAIMLHEIGHMISVLEMAAEVYYMNDVIKRATEYFGEHAAPSEVSKYISDTLLTQSKELPEGFMDKLSAGLASRSSQFGRFVRSVMNMFSVLGVVLFPLSIVTRFFGNIVDKVNYNKLNMKVKQSDLYGYTQQLHQTENYADNFVVRHGYGSYLISAQKKLEEVVSRKSVIGKDSARLSNFQWSVAKFPAYVSAILFGNMQYRTDAHGSFTERAENMLQETLKVFRNDNLPPDVLAYYLNDYKTCQMLLQRKPGITSLRDSMEKFYRFVEYVMATPITLFGSARFDQEYEKLIQHVNSLKNNKLYYFKAVFQNYLNNN